VLWWVCVKERNRLATEKIERYRLDAGYGDYENKNRDDTVQKTMKAILDTLAERQQAYAEAVELAERDPSIDLTRVDGPQFTEPAYVRTVFDVCRNSLMLLLGCDRTGRRGSAIQIMIVLTT